MLLLLSALVLGCAHPTETSRPAGALIGTLPEAPRPVPEFEVLAQTGEPRTQADLLGHPTVMWFYPMAGTPG